MAIYSHARRVVGYTRRLADTLPVRRPRVQPVLDLMRRKSEPVERVDGASAAFMRMLG